MFRNVALATAGALIVGGCEVVGPLLGDEDAPEILITIEGRSFSSDDAPPGTEFPCVNVDPGPAHVDVLASDAGGLERLYIHLIHGFVVDGSVTITPDEDDISWEITTGDTVLTEGDDELTVQLVPPSDGTVRTGVSVGFDLQGDARYALQTLATDYAGNDSITWPFLVHELNVHGPCPE